MKTFSEINEFRHLGKDNRTYGIKHSIEFIPDCINKQFNDCSILDFGCGKQALKKHLRKEFEYYPYDIDSNVNCFHKLPNNSFNAIVSNHVLEHLTLKEINEFLEYCSKKGEWLFVATINLNPISIYEFYRTIDHITPLWHEDLSTLIKSYNFEVKRIHFSVPYVNPMKILIAVGCRALPFTQFTIIAKNRERID